MIVFLSVLYTMQDDSDNPQDYGEREEPRSIEQGEQYQQQQSPPPPPPPSQRPSQKESDPEKPMKMMVLAGLVAVIILVAAFFVFYNDSKSLVGKWRYKTSIEEEGMDQAANVTMTIDLKDNGTGEINYAISMGEYSQNESSEIEWEKTGDGEMNITSNGETRTIEYELRDRGNTLVIISDYFGSISNSEEIEFDRV